MLNLILKKENLYKVYRLLCIYSLSEGGFKGKHYEVLKKELVETYGFEQLEVLSLLSQANILYNRDTKKIKCPFAQFKKPQKLINLDYDTEDPNRKSFPYNAYTPLSIKVIENAFKGTWMNGDLVDKLPGYTSVSGDPRNAAGSKTQKKVVVLYMIGGITYAEVSCLRYVAKQYNIELLIATTNIINYRRILQPFLD
jgi:hypothetical protein